MSSGFRRYSILFLDGCYCASAYSTAAFTNSEASSIFKSDWSDQFNSYCDVVTRHNHFSTFWQVDDTSYVSCTEVELWTVACEERLMTATLFFSQNVDLCSEVSVWFNRTRFSQELDHARCLYGLHHEAMRRRCRQLERSQAIYGTSQRLLQRIYEFLQQDR